MEMARNLSRLCNIEVMMFFTCVYFLDLIYLQGLMYDHHPYCRFLEYPLLDDKLRWLGTIIIYIIRIVIYICIDRMNECIATDLYIILIGQHT